jgi:HPt (histidine-containing phosphotransfer) domain-containing protein
MHPQHSDPKTDLHLLVDTVDVALRASFLKSIPGRLAAIERIAERARGRTEDARALSELHAEAHRLAGTTAVYGLLGASEVARRFDQMLIERIHSGAAMIGTDLLHGFLQDFMAALHADC